MEEKNTQSAIIIIINGYAVDAVNFVVCVLE